MVRVTLVRAVARSPSEVREAYRRWVDSDGPTHPGEEAHEVHPTDANHLRFTRTGRTRLGAIRVEGIVSFEADDRWDCRREIELNGAPYSRESQWYHVAPRPDGTDLTVGYELHAESMLHEFLLEFAHHRLLLERSRELDRWLPGVWPAGP